MPGLDLDWSQIIIILYKSQEQTQPVNLATLVIADHYHSLPHTKLNVYDNPDYQVADNIIDVDDDKYKRKSPLAMIVKWGR